MKLIKPNKDKFMLGAFFIASEAYRMHGCGVTLSDCLNILGDINAIARASCEYDVKLVREEFPDLPMGCDADYSALIIKFIDLDEKEVEYSEDALYLGIYGVSDNGTELLTKLHIGENVCETIDNASIQITKWQKELKQNKRKGYKL